MSLRATRSFAAVLFCAAVTPGCAAAVGAGASPREPASAEGAEAALERAQGELEAALGKPDEEAPPAASSAGFGRKAAPRPADALPPPPLAPSPAPPPPAPGVAPSREAEHAAAAQGGPSAGAAPGAARCAGACRALASMERAASTLCALAAGSRCADAQERVRRASDRVRDACPACGD